jgi:Fic family protein
MPKRPIQTGRTDTVGHPIKVAATATSRADAPNPADTRWPAITHEQRDWEPKFDTGRLADMITKTYKPAIPPDIAGLTVNIDADTAAICREASTEITRFDSELGTEIGPFAPILLRSESASSSEIEQLTATAKRVLMAESGDTSRGNATLIASNTAAMTAALELSDNVTGDSILAMHRALLGDKHSDWAGQWRTEPVWIGGGATGPENALYVAPHHHRVPALMEDLAKFADRTDIEPLTKALIAHAQFETIHPFPDGNGRTGRALIHSMLRHDRLTINVTVPVSAGLLTETERYFQALGAYRDGNPNAIVELGAAASLRAVQNGRQLAGEMAEAKAEWHIKLGSVRSDSVVWKIVDTLIERPVLDADSVAEQHGVTTTAARTAINRMVEADVLKQANAGLRFRKWIATDVATALDRFAERAGRRNTA